MKKLFILILLGIFLLSFTSAVTWDNTQYWALDETTGVVVDETGNGYDGINLGADRGVAGIINNAFNFSGQNQDQVKFNVTNYQDRTLNLWVKVSSYANIGTILSADGPSFTYGGTVIQSSSDQITINQGTESVSYDTLRDEWIMVTLIQNSTNATYYINGSLIATRPISTFASASEDDFLKLGADRVNSSNRFFNGTIDEVGIWNRELSAAEINELYNGGNGVIFGGEELINLESPTNGTTISDIGTNFTVSGGNLSSVSGTWDNVTYYVWKNSTLINETSVLVSSGEKFNETQFIDDFTLGDYEWGVLACYTNSTSSYCINSTNSTFTVSLFTLVSEGYSNETLSGTLETFNISIQLFTGYELTNAIFYYDGETRSPTITSDDDNRFVIVSDYQIPSTILDVNNSFYWSLEFNDNETINTDNRTQLVRALLLDNCSTYTNILFNLTLHDEETQTPINGEIELVYSLLNRDYDVIKTFNFSVSNVSTTNICSALNLSEEDLYYSAEIRYVSEGYVPELYHIQRADISPYPINVSLYSLNESDSTEFKITYQDNTFNFVEGAIVQLQRRYISEDAYKVVEAPITSNEGIAVLHIDLDSIKYRIVVVKDGEVLDTFDNIVFKCQSELTGECEQKLLGEIDPQNTIDYDTQRDFTYSVTAGENNITISYVIPSLAPSSVNIVLTQKDEFGNETKCNKTIVSSGGSIICEYDETLGTNYLELKINKNNVPISQNTYVIDEETGMDFLDNNYIIVVVLMLSLVGLALASPEWIIVNSVITLLLSGMLWLVNGINFVMGLGLLMWLVIAAGIIILKLSKQEDR